MMGKLLFLLLLFACSVSLAQDERYFRQIFSGELVRDNAIKEEEKYAYFIHTPYYAIDINHDKIPEEIVFVKKDSEDWIEIFQIEKGERKKILSYRFEAKGYDSQVYRIEFKRISPLTSVLVFYYYEGVSRYIESQSTSRVYVASIDNNDVKTLSVFKGPAMYEEFKSQKGHYHLRNYQVYFQDLNNDEVKELVVKFHLTSQVFMYDSAGKWKSFSSN